MRRITFRWTYLVLAIVLIGYGTFSLIYNHTHNKEMSILALVFCILGAVMLVFYFVLFVIDFSRRKRPVVIKEEPKIEEPIEEIKEEIKVEAPKEENKPVTTSYSTKKKKVTYNKSRYDSDDDSYSYYINKVGYGPVLRVTGREILDMRSNTYYRIEGNMVNQAGSGPVFEISGNRIRSAFGGYLYEISGDSVNKIYGGYFASFTGNYLTTFDLREKYEVPSLLNLKQQLAVVVLLFGSY